MTRKNSNSVLILGPPCSGKSTIARRLARSLGLEAVTLDSFVGKLKDELGLKEGVILTDQQVDVALEQFLDIMWAQSIGCLYELPYHNYLSLFARVEPAFLNEFHLVMLDADIETLLARNSERVGGDRIPNAYIARCHQSTRELITHPAARHFKTSMYFDTAIVPMEETIMRITDLMLSP